MKVGDKFKYINYNFKCIFCGSKKIMSPAIDSEGNYSASFECGFSEKSVFGSYSNGHIFEIQSICPNYDPNKNTEDYKWITQQEAIVCTCSKEILFSHGCQCGYIQKYKIKW